MWHGLAGCAEAVKLTFVASGHVSVPLQLTAYSAGTALYAGMVLVCAMCLYLQ